MGVCRISFIYLLGALEQHSGGDPHASAQSARVILADPNTEMFHHLIKVYQGMPDKYVESFLWVKKCIEKGAVVYTPLVYKNPGGRRPGEEYDYIMARFIIFILINCTPQENTVHRRGRRALVWVDSFQDTIQGNRRSNGKSAIPTTL